MGKQIKNTQLNKDSQEEDTEYLSLEDIQKLFSNDGEVSNKTNDEDYFDLESIKGIGNIMQESSDLDQSTTPKISDYENVSSLTNEEINRYSEYIPEGIPDIPKEDILELVSERQGTANKLGSGVVRLGLTAATKTGAGIGYIASVAMEAAESMFSDQTFEEGLNDALNNSFSAAFDNMEESVKQDIAPIFESKKYKEGNLWQQLGTAEFWASDFADGLAFAASTYIPGIGLSKIGTGIKVAKGLSRIKKINDLQKTARITDRSIAYATMSSMEAAVESKGVRDQVYDKLIKKGYKHSEALKIASEKAADTFIMNMAVLAPSNLLETKMLFKPLKGSTRATKGVNRNLNKWTDGAIDYKGFERFRKGYGGELTKRIAAATVSEGLWEENSQLAIEHLNTHYGEVGERNTLLKSFSKLPGQMGDNLGTTEGRKAILLGALVGGPLATYSGIRDKSAENTRRVIEVNNLNNSHTNFKADKEGGIYKKKVKKVIDSKVVDHMGEPGSEIFGDNYGWVQFEGEPKKRINTKEEFDDLVANGKEVVELDSKGNPVVDEALLAKMGAERIDSKNLDYLIEAAYENKDWVNYRLLRKEKFKNLAKTYFDAGQADELYEFLDEVSKMTPEQLQNMGLDAGERDDKGNIIDIKKTISDFKRDAVFLQKQYDQIERGTLPDKAYGKGLQQYSARKRELFNIASRKYAVKGELDRVNATISAATADSAESPIATKLNVYENRIANLNEQIVHHKNIIAGARVAGKDEYAPTVAKDKIPEMEKELVELEKEFEKYKEDNASQILELTIDDLGNYRSKDTIRNKELAIAEIKKAELEAANKDLNTIEDKLMDPIKGQKYYENNINEIEQNKTSNILQTMPKSALLITNNKDYVSYERSRIKSETIKNKILNINKEFFEESIQKRLYEGENIVDIVKDVLDIQAPLSPAGTKFIKEALETHINEINTSQEELLEDIWLNYFPDGATKEEVEQISNNILNAVKTGTLEYMDEEDIETSKAFAKFKEESESIKKSEGYEQLDKDLENVLELQENFNSLSPDFTIKSLSPEEIKESLAEEFFKKDVQGIKQDFELNEEYDNEGEVNNALAVLRKLKSLFSKRKGFNNLKKNIDAEIKALQDINNALEKRKQDREKKQEDVQKNYTEGAYAKLGIILTEDGYTINPEYLEIIEQLKTAITNFDEILKDAATSGFPPIYAEVIEQLVADTALNNPGFYSALVELLNKKIGDTQQVISNMPRITKKGADKKIVEYFKAPAKSLDSILFFIREAPSTVEDSKYDFDNPNSSYEKYTNDRDIVAFLKNLQKEVDNDVTPIRKEILAFIVEHTNLVRLVELKDRLNNSYDIGLENYNEEDALTLLGNTPIPTKQQMLAIRALTKNYDEPINEELFSGWSYLKGFAGTGKTNIVMKWVMETIQDISSPTKEVFAVGHTEESTSGIINSLNSQSTANMDSLLNGEIPESTKLIVIDEIGAMSQDQIEKISAVIQSINKIREEGDKIHTIVLGDPNQRVAGESNPLESSFLMEGDTNIKIVPPLTVRYRSNVGAVVSFQDKFINQRKDVSAEPLVVKSNTNNPAKEDAFTDILGVFGASNTSGDSFAKNIIEILTVRKENSNTKAVIVNNDQISYYRNLLNQNGLEDIEVLTVENAQGRTIDEVYMNINKDDSHANTKAYNTDIYTASSRAAKFIFIGGMRVVQELNTDINEDTSARETLVAKRKEELTKEINESKEVIEKYHKIPERDDVDDTGTDDTDSSDTSDITKTDIPTNSKDYDYDDFEDIDNDLENDDFTGTTDGEVVIDGVPPANNEPIVGGYKENHTLANVSHTAFNDDLDIGDDVLYVVDKYTDKNGNVEARVRIVKPLSNNKYQQLGILGREELNTLPTNMRNVLTDAMNSSVSMDAFNEFNDDGSGILSGEIVAAYTGKISAVPNKLTYVYDQSSPEILSPSIFKKIVQHFKKIFLGDPNAPTPSGIRIFTKKGGEIDELKARGIFIKPGIPYLVFNNPSKASSMGGAKPQFIRLNPRKINSKIHTELTAPMIEFIKNLNKIDKIINSPDTSFVLGNLEYNRLIKLIADKKTKEARLLLAKYSKVKIEEISELAKIINDAIYTKNNTKNIEFGDFVQNKDSKKLFTKIKTTTITTVKGVKRKIKKKVVVPLKVLEVSSDKKKVKLLIDKKEVWMNTSELNLDNRATPGPVQHIFNLIARSNGIVGDIPIRQYTGENTFGKGLLVDTVIDFKNIKKIDGTLNSKRALKYIKRLGKRAGFIEDPLNKETFAYQYLSTLSIDEKLSIIKRLTSTISKKELETMFSFNDKGDSTAANGFGLRVPIPLAGEGFNFTDKEIKKYNIPKNSSTSAVREYFFENTFKEVVPDQITVGDTGPADSNTDSDPNTQQDDDDVLDSMKFLEIKEDDSGDLGKKLTKKEALKYLRKRLPNATEDQLKFVEKAALHKRAGKKVWGLWSDGVISLIKGQSLTKILRHEIFHEVFNNYLTDLERGELYSAVENELGKKGTRLQMEEALADAYQNYRQGESFGKKITKFFEWLGSVFGFYADNRTVIEKLFDAIEQGKFTEYSPESLSGSRNMIKIIEDFGSIETFLTSKKMLTNGINYFTNDIYENEKISKILDKGNVINGVKMPMSRIEMLRAVSLQYLPAIKTALEKKQNPTDEDLSKIEAITKLEDPYKFIELIKDFYPSLNIKPGKKISGLSDKDMNDDVSNKDSIDKQQDEEAKLDDNGQETSLYENFIQEGDQVNHETKILQSVKDFISVIGYSTGEGVNKKFHQVDSRYAFVLLMKNLPGINFSDFSIARKQLTRSFGSTNPKSKAVLDKLRSLMNTVEKGNYKLLSPFPNNGRFTNPSTFTYDTTDGVKIIEASSYKNSTDFYNAIITNANVVFEKIPKLLQRDLKRLPTTLEVQKEKTFLIKKMYEKAFASNTLNEMVTAVGSLREKHVRTGIREYIYGATDNKYISHQESGFTTTARAVLENIISTAGPTFLKYVKIFENAEDSNDEIKDKASKSLLIKLGVFSQDDFIPDTSLTFEALKGIIKKFQDMSNNNKKGKKIKYVDENDKEQERLQDGADIVKDSSKRIKVLIDVLKANTTETRSTNYTAGDGTRRYMFLNSSSVIDTLRNLTTPYLRDFGIPKYLQSKFFNRNILVNSKNTKLSSHKLVDYIDHDSIRELDSKYSPQEYKKESRKEWHTRNFSFGFMSMLKSNNTSDTDIPTYIQQFWTISNKPNITAAEITLLSDSNKSGQIREAIKEGVLQELDRLPNNIKNYNNNNTISVFPGVKDGKIIYGIPVIKNKKEAAARVEDIYKALEIKTEELLEEYVKELVRFDTNTKEKNGATNTAITLNNMRRRGYLNDKFSKVLGLPKSIDNYKINSSFEKLSIEEKEKITDTLKDNLRPLVDLYNKNSYINGHFLNQIALGDTAYFKPGTDNSFDIIKRISIAFGIGQKGMVNENYGMKEKFTMAVGEDVKKVLTPEEYVKFKKIIGKDFELSDAQGFARPSRVANIKKGFGVGANITATMKPVYYGINEDGIPTGVKYSSIELNEELVAMFPSLGKLLADMEKNNVDEFVFGSGVKLGQPNTLSKQSGEIHEIDPKSIITLDNNNWRIQLNPYHDATDQLVAHPTQLTYQTNTNGLNYKASMKLHNLQTKLIEKGVEIMTDKLGLDGNTRAYTKKAIRRTVIQSLEDLTGGERTLEFLSAVDNDGNPIISMNMPFIINKIVTQMSSLISKNTVGIKYKGAKLVLQSAYGTNQAVIKDKLVNRKMPKWRDKDGYAEVYLPDMYKKDLNIGDEFLLDKKLLGFRIPGTELHSAIPLKVIGFYPTTEKNENIIIAPPEIVFFHGSDYDIDTLYVIRREEATKEYKNLKEEIIAKEGEFIGYKNGKHIPNFIEDLEKEFSTIKKLIRQSKDDVNERKRLINLKKDLDDVYIAAIKNQTVDTLMDIIRADINEESMMTPISMDRFKDDIFDMMAKQKGFKKPRPSQKNKLKKWIEERNTYLYPHRDLNDQIDQASMHQDNFSGDALTGAFANMNKAMAYLFQAARVTEKDENAVPKLIETLHIEINGTIYNEMSINEKIAGKDGKKVDNKVTIGNTKDTYTPTIWESVDMFINSAIDNVKEQILSVVNATNITGPAYMGYISLGIPLDQVVILNTQPIIKSISNGKIVNIMLSTGRSRIKTLIESKLEEGETIDSLKEKVVLNTKTLLTLTEKSLEELTKEELVMQDKVMELFRRASIIGDAAFVSPSSALKVLQVFPTNYHEQQDKKDAFNAMYKDKDNTILSESFPFYNADLLKLPHIKEAYNTLILLNSKISDIFYKHNKNLISFSKNISKKFSISLDINENKSEERIREEFIKYILMGTKVDVIEDGKNIYTYNFDTREEEPIEYTHWDRKKLAVGVDAWNQRFIETVEKAQKTSNNLFLKGIEIKRDHSTSLKYIKFTTLSNMDQTDVLRYADAFEKLNTDPGLEFNNFQRDFVKYSILNQGLSFGSTNFSMVLPPKIYKEISKELDTTLLKLFIEEDTLIKNKTDNKVYSTLKKVMDHFAIQIAVNYPESVGYVRLDAIKEQDSFSGITPKGIIYDLKYALSEGKNAKYSDHSEFPLIISRFKEKAYIKLPKGESDTEVYYQAIAKKPSSGTQYQADKEVFLNGYNLNKAFPSNMLVRSVENNLPNTKNILTYQNIRIDTFKVGQEVLIRNFSDITRTKALIYTVLSVKKNTEKAKTKNELLKNFTITLGNPLSLAEETGLYEIVEEVEESDSPIDPKEIERDDAGSQIKHC